MTSLTAVGENGDIAVNSDLNGMSSSQSTPAEETQAIAMTESVNHDLTIKMREKSMRLRKVANPRAFSRPSLLQYGNSSNQKNTKKAEGGEESSERMTNSLDATESTTVDAELPPLEGSQESWESTIRREIVNYKEAYYDLEVEYRRETRRLLAEIWTLEREIFGTNGPTLPEHLTGLSLKDKLQQFIQEHNEMQRQLEECQSELKWITDNRQAERDSHHTILDGWKERYRTLEIALDEATAAYESEIAEFSKTTLVLKQKSAAAESECAHLSEKVGMLLTELEAATATSTHANGGAGAGEEEEEEEPMSKIALEMAEDTQRLVCEKAGLQEALQEAEKDLARVKWESVDFKMKTKGRLKELEETAEEFQAYKERDSDVAQKIAQLQQQLAAESDRNKLLESWHERGLKAELQLAAKDAVAVRLMTENRSLQAAMREVQEKSQSEIAELARTVEEIGENWQLLQSAHAKRTKIGLSEEEAKRLREECHDLRATLVELLAASHPSDSGIDSPGNRRKSSAQMLKLMMEVKDTKRHRTQAELETKKVRAERDSLRVDCSVWKSKCEDLENSLKSNEHILIRALDEKTEALELLDMLQRELDEKTVKRLRQELQR
jgi:hypothetical protein